MTGQKAWTCLIALCAAGRLEAVSMNLQAAKLESELVSKYGEAARPAIARGLKQAAEFWQPKDGSEEDFSSFVRNNYAGEPAAREALFLR